ncbi:MAG: POT family MFS transporter [Gammaproteobacteria bacterium]|nr:POT family MFS transporter [Gammaproteobacteria bacterium]
MSKYRDYPLSIHTIPPGIPFIVANEAAERFSYYGMRAILVVFMTQYLIDGNGQLAVMSEDQAKGYFHLFVSAVYFTPLLGALLADSILGKYRTIIVLSLVYCFGHFALALDETRSGLFAGQALIALGAGGIKPCVSAHVGDQFCAGNSHLLTRVYGWFYIAINVGAFISMLLTPWLLVNYGASVAFAVPGVLMLIATLIFWSGRYRYAHISPGGPGFFREVFSLHGLQILSRLFIIYLFVAVFWSLFDQTGSSWVLQAQKMDRDVLGYSVLPSQIQAANPLLILLLVPLFSTVIYPRLNRLFNLTALRKIAIGLFLAVFAFAVSSWIQIQIDSGNQPHIGWQFLAYLILTASEVMVSITCLEFSYTQAPRPMKSFIMAFFMLSVALGNLLTSLVNFFIQNEDGSSLLAGANYFVFFTGLMLTTACLFLFVIRYYKETLILQKEISELS